MRHISFPRDDLQSLDCLCVAHHIVEEDRAVLLNPVRRSSTLETFQHHEGQPDGTYHGNSYVADPFATEGVKVFLDDDSPFSSTFAAGIVTAAWLMAEAWAVEGVKQTKCLGSLNAPLCSATRLLNAVWPHFGAPGVAALFEAL
jgi:hypothetical protein